MLGRLLVAACFSSLGLAEAAARPLPPVDEARQDRALVEMRERLVQALARKDPAALAPLTRSGG